jgi:hypothetical protein
MTYIIFAKKQAKIAFKLRHHRRHRYSDRNTLQEYKMPRSS